MPVVLAKPSDSVKIHRRGKGISCTKFLTARVLLHAGSVVLTVEERLEDRQNVTAVLDHAPAEFA